MASTMPLSWLLHPVFSLLPALWPLHPVCSLLPGLWPLHLVCSLLPGLCPLHPVCSLLLAFGLFILSAVCCLGCGHNLQPGLRPLHPVCSLGFVLFILSAVCYLGCGPLLLSALPVLPLHPVCSLLPGLLPLHLYACYLGYGLLLASFAYVSLFFKNLKFILGFLDDELCLCPPLWMSRGALLPLFTARVTASFVSGLRPTLPPGSTVRT
jgi:hypothetical protein